MSRVGQAFGKAFGYSLFVAAIVSVVAWNTREKCLAGTGLLSDFGYGCPTPVELGVAIALLAASVFGVAGLRGLRKSIARDAGAGQINEA